MSITTSVIMHVGQADGDRLDDFSAALARATGDARYTLNDAATTPAAWGGWKHPILNLWTGAFNHLDERELLNVVEEFGWNDPDEVQVFISSSDLYDTSKLRLLRGDIPRWDAHLTDDPMYADRT